MKKKFEMGTLPLKWFSQNNNEIYMTHIMSQPKNWPNLYGSAQIR